MNKETTNSREAFREQYGCPDWCTVSEEHHAQDDPGQPLHGSNLDEGNHTRLWQNGNGPIEASIEFGSDSLNELTADDLRTLSRRALATADELDQLNKDREATSKPGWRSVVEATFSKAGWTISGLPDSLTEEQANGLLEGFLAAARAGALREEESGS